MENTYFKNYLKYKKKYLDLKKLDGGTKMEHISNITGNLLLSNHQPLVFGKMLVWNIENQEDNEKRINNPSIQLTLIERYKRIFIEIDKIINANERVQIIGLQEFVSNVSPDGNLLIRGELSDIIHRFLLESELTFVIYTPKNTTNYTKADKPYFFNSQYGNMIFKIRRYPNEANGTHEYTIEKKISESIDIFKKNYSTLIRECIYNIHFTTRYFNYIKSGANLFINLHGTTENHDLPILNEYINKIFKEHYISEIYIGGDFNKNTEQVTLYQWNINDFSRISIESIDSKHIIVFKRSN